MKIERKLKNDHEHWSRNNKDEDINDKDKQWNRNHKDEDRNDKDK